MTWTSIRNCITTAFGIILLYHFVLLWSHGRIIITEPNHDILLAEIFIAGIFTLFSIAAMILEE